MEKEINITRKLPKQIVARTASKGKKGWRQAEVLLAIQFLKASGTFFNYLFPPSSYALIIYFLLLPMIFLLISITPFRFCLSLFGSGFLLKDILKDFCFK